MGRTRQCIPVDGTDAPAAVAETHTGIVFLVGDRAYKVKKRVDLGFLDFTTREARERACRREVELNRRLAPDVYLGVADIHGVDGALSDHMVVMRRMPAERRLATLVTEAADAHDDLRRIARAVASFHADATRPPAAATAAGRSALEARWEANVRETQPFIGNILDEALAGMVPRLARRYLDGRGHLFESRIRAGHALDGHGDLLADDIFCLDDGPRILDCLEFDDGLRYGDALADVAFLAMDLERLGRPDLAATFLADYREFAADSWPASLAHHHIAYRAHVRCKVACLRAAQGDATAVDQARSLLRLTHDHLDRGRVRLVLVAGLPGVGKSTVAAALAERLDAFVLRSDEVRKELLGLQPTDRATAGYREGAYAARFTWATYHTMLRRAEQLLGSGESVVMDATWLDPSWRGQAERLATTTAADLTAIRCVLPLEQAAARLRARAFSDASDATVDVQHSMAAMEQPWPIATDLDTSASPDVVAAAAVRLVDRTPVGVSY